MVPFYRIIGLALLTLWNNTAKYAFVNDITEAFHCQHNITDMKSQNAFLILVHLVCLTSLGNLV